jgi:hypothetical protein
MSDGPDGDGGTPRADHDHAWSKVEDNTDPVLAVYRCGVCGETWTI